MSKVSELFASWRRKIEPQLIKGKAQTLQRWQRLQPREQVMLKVMAVVVAATILWFGMWQPLQDREMRAEAALAGTYNTQRYVETQIAQVLRARGDQEQRAAAISATELSGVVTTLSNEFDLEVSRMQPQSESLLLVFNEADFNNLIRFLARLSERQVVIEAIDISETNDAGMVRVRRLLIRA